MGASIDFIKDRWNQGKYWEAIVKLNDRLPQISLEFFWGSKYSEAQTELLFAQYGWRFFGGNSVPTWWREVWHFLGGFFMTVPFLYWPTVCFAISVAIALWKAGAEFYGDADGAPDLKNFVDWLFWIAGTGTLTVISFLLFGKYPYI